MFKRNRIATSIAISVLFVLSGCATPGSAPVQKPLPSQSAVTGSPPSTPASTPPSAGENLAQGSVVFFRESAFVGGGLSFIVREGKKEIGKLSSGTYFTAHLPAGAHTFEVHSEAKDTLSLEVEAGETYYVQGSVTFGVLIARPGLAPSNAAVFEAMRPKLKETAALTR